MISWYKHGSKLMIKINVMIKFKLLHISVIHLVPRNFNTSDVEQPTSEAR